MARTAQNARASRSTRDVCKQHFVDHAGHQALRYGYSDKTPTNESPWPPVDYSAHPKFCFQVYLSFDTDLDNDDAEEPVAKRARVNNESAPWKTSKCARISQYLADLSEAQRPPPLWDFYVMPGASVLDFVEHSRKEMLHRKQLRNAGDLSVPLIGMITGGREEDKTSAFLFAVDNAESWRAVNVSTGPLKWPDETGPIWVRFDQRLPSTVLSLQEAWQMPVYVPGTDDIDYLSEQLEMTVTRIQHREHSNSELSSIYKKSMGPAWLLEASEEDGGDKNGGINFGNDATGDSDPPSADQDVRHVGDDLVQTILDERGITMHEQDQAIRVANSTDSESDLRYVIFVPFLWQQHKALSDFARRFTAALLAHLPGTTTIQLHFHVPSHPTDASSLAHYETLQLPEKSVGIRTEMQADRSFDDPFDYVRPKEPHPRRLHPLQRQPHIFNNDPATFQRKPYSTFIIIVDRPDFDQVPAVRFLLANGGSFRAEHTDAQLAEMYKAQDYIEMESWRSPSMRDVVRRLTLEQPRSTQ